MPEALLSSLLALAASDALADTVTVDAGDVDTGADPAARTMDEVVVTGTHLRASEASQVSPVQVLDQQSIERYGASQLVDVLRAVPSNAGSELYSEASTRAGTAQFNLRGLGFSSTLTLVNGRRAGFAPISDRTGGDFVDINQFPLAMVERIEVLKDGASALYGSDAVAGVVNVITRKDFRGLELSAQYTDASNEAMAVNLALGGDFDRGSFTLFGTYYAQSGNDRTDFDWLVERIHGDGTLGRSQLLSGTSNPSTYRRAVPAANGTYTRMTGARPFADPNCEAAGGVFRIRDDGSVDSSTCLQDFADQVSIIPETERVQTFAQFDYEVGPGMTFIGEVGFSQNVAKTTKGPGAFQNGMVTAAGAGDIFIPASHPFNFFVADPADARNLVYIGPQAWNPAVHTAVDLTAPWRPFGSELNGDNAPRRRSDVDYTHLMSGVELELGSNWNGQVSYSYSRGAFTENEPLEYNADLLNQLVLNGRLNPFGTAEVDPGLVSPKDGVTTASNSEQVLRQIQATAVRSSRSVQGVADATINGVVPGPWDRDIGLAGGAQYRRARLNETPDSLTAAGEARGASFESPVSGAQNVWALFAEAGVSLTDDLDLQLALRHEDYGSKIGSTTDPKIATSFKAAEWLQLRGSWSTSFQAPTLRQTSSAVSRDFLNDPVTLTDAGLRCQPSGVTTNVLINVQGDESLQPQSSTNYTFGLVMQPAHMLRLSADYWHYNYTDLIAPGASGQAIVNNDCADDGLPNDPRIVRASDGTVLQIDTSFVNVGQVLTEGIDVSALYDLDTRAGALQFSLDATNVTRFDVAGGEGGSFSGLGSRNFTNNFAPIPRWRAAGRIGWSLGSHELSVTTRFIDGFRNDQSNNAKVASMTTLDLQYQLDLTSLTRTRTVLLLGADNVFDEDPPALRRNDANGNPVAGTINVYDRPGYEALAGHDIRGRILYFRALQRF